MVPNNTVLLPTSSNLSVVTNLKSTIPSAIASTNFSVMVDPIKLDNSTINPQSSAKLVALFGTTSMDMRHTGLVSFSLPTSTDSAFFPAATYSPTSTSRPVVAQQKPSSSSRTQKVASSSGNRILSPVSSLLVNYSQTASTSSISAEFLAVAAGPITSQAGPSYPHSLGPNRAVVASTARPGSGQSVSISASRSSKKWEKDY